LSDIQVLKQNIGQEAEHIIASGLNLEKVGSKYRCPNKLEHKNGDRNPSMSWYRDGLQFKCFTCGLTIDIYDYYTKYLNYTHIEALEAMGAEKNNTSNNRNKIHSQKSNFNNELKRFVSPIKTSIKYFKKRGLKEETISYFKLGTFDGRPAIPYYSDNGKITGIKIRKLDNTKPKYYAITGSKFGLFNKKNVKDTSQLIITEGEFDCMIIHQCGFHNVVSVGTGANSLTELLQQERSFLDGFSSLIILADNDEYGSNMETEFLKVFKYKVKLPNKELYKGCKDVTELYLKIGEDGVKNLVDSAMRKIEGLRDLDIEPYRGVEALEGKYIPTGLPTIDFALNDLSPGLVTLVTGRANSGKSTLTNQIICNAIDKNNKVLLIAGEGIQELIINNLYKAVIGRNEEYFEYVQVNKRKFKEPKPEVLKALQLWHKEKLVLFSKGDSKLKTTDELFDLLNVEIKTNQYNLVVLDNLMSILSVEKASEKLEAQADFMQRCSDLAKAQGIHLILVLHPNKTVTKNSEMEFEQISGTLDLPNKADNIISIKREYDEEKLNQGINGTIKILKNRYFPDLPEIEVHYDEETGLLLEIDKNTRDYLAYTFGWMRYLKGHENSFSVPEGFQEVIKGIGD